MSFTHRHLVWLTAAALVAPSPVFAATGLAGSFYQFSDTANPSGPRTLANTQALINAAGHPTATFTANTICFPDCVMGSASVSAYTPLNSFLGASASNISPNSVAYLYVSAIELVGYLNIATAGLHVFDLYSDDGTSIYIDGAPVVVEDGENLIGVKHSGSATLSAGSHTIRILHFEDGGMAGFKLLQDSIPISGVSLSTTPLAATGGAVPEPATWAMMIFGFGGMVYVMRRKRASVADGIASTCRS